MLERHSFDPSRASPKEIDDYLGYFNSYTRTEGLVRVMLSHAFRPHVLERHRRAAVASSRHARRIAQKSPGEWSQGLVCRPETMLSSAFFRKGT